MSTGNLEDSVNVTFADVRLARTVAGRTTVVNCGVAIGVGKDINAAWNDALEWFLKDYPVEVRALADTIDENGEIK